VVTAQHYCPVLDLHTCSRSSGTARAGGTNSFIDIIIYSGTYDMPYTSTECRKKLAHKVFESTEGVV